MKCAVIGGGSWGTAIACLLARNDHQVRMWALESEVIDEINKQQRNSLYLPEAKLPEGVRASDSFKDILEGAEIIFSVVPSQFLRSVIRRMLDFIPDEIVIVSATKGIENETLATMSEVYQKELGGRGNRRIAALAGPSFAKEVVRRYPTAVVVATENPDDAVIVQEAFSTDFFRIYTATDLIGVEICGAVKNVIAIASGILAGLGFGDNTRAGLITRGLAEIARLVQAKGGRRQTVAGLAGVGDMVLTCTSTTSRNFSVGQRLGLGESLEEITSSMPMIAEGVRTTKSVAALAERGAIEMPISQAVNSILYSGLQPREAVKQLMTRELKEEWETFTGGKP